MGTGACGAACLTSMHNEYRTFLSVPKALAPIWALPGLALQAVQGPSVGPTCMAPVSCKPSEAQTVGDAC